MTRDRRKLPPRTLPREAHVRPPAMPPKLQLIPADELPSLTDLRAVHQEIDFLLTCGLDRDELAREDAPIPFALTEKAVRHG